MFYFFVRNFESEFTVDFDFGVLQQKQEGAVKYLMQR